MPGYIGKLLRVDLTREEIHEERLGEDVLRKYIGGYGLGLKYVYDECPPGIDALDPVCPLAFFTGPLTGTLVPGATDITCITKNFDTGFTIGRAHSHGKFGISLKAAGYDGIVITGQAKIPVYLWIHDGLAEIRDARKFWGHDTHETEDLIKHELAHEGTSVAAIGPAGEHLCCGSMIANDKNHSMSHSGVGAVMGFKRLKAIAVYGKQKVSLADPEKVRTIAEEWRNGINFPGASADIIGQGGVGRNAKNYGVWATERGAGLSAFNFKGTPLTGFMQDAEHVVTPRPCPGCPIGCPYDLEITAGPHKGHIATLAGGGPVEGCSMMGVTESGAVFYLIDLLDRLGLEASTTSCSISLAFEAFERGLIIAENTEGLALNWGDATVIEKLIRKYAYREGFGNVLAEGPKGAAEIIGGDAPALAVHVKGSGINLHDWRGYWGFMLGQILGSGAGFMSTGTEYRADPDAGFPEKTPDPTRKEKAEQVAKTAINKYIYDSIGVCWFLTNGRPGVLDLITAALSAVTGWSWSKKELLACGARIANLERAYNIRHGLTPLDDHTDISPRLLEAALSGPGKGKTLAPYLVGMVNEYYRLMGWDEKTGIPLKRTLKRCELDDIAADLWGDLKKPRKKTMRSTR